VIGGSNKEIESRPAGDRRSGRFFVLLIVAGLLINSFFHLRNLDRDLQRHLLTMKVNLW
jgi:hypothetical protein